jgi:lysophospholipase L1-like esterase
MARSLGSCLVILLLSEAGLAQAGPALPSLAAKVGAQDAPIVEASRLARFASKVQRTKGGAGVVKVLHLGDSHVAADLITKTIRAELQGLLGDAGRGFTAVDQSEKGGGRGLGSTAGWKRDRIVDKGREGIAFGFGGSSLESVKKGAKLEYRASPEDRSVELYFEAGPGRGRVEIYFGKARIAELDTANDTAVSRTHKVSLPEARASKDTLRIVAPSAPVRLFGLTFETGKAGILYSVIGPVGADAKVYLDLERKSFTDQLQAASPDLVVLMVGGNDALKVRKKWRTIEEVRRHHEELLSLLSSTLPNADILLWTPMDAGEKKKGAVATLPFIAEVAALQREVAKSQKVAVYDALGSMGGVGSIAKWAKEGIMNADLVHPKSKAAELLGLLFVRSFVAALQI